MGENFVYFCLLTGAALAFELVSVLIDRWVLNPQETLREKQLSAEAAKIRHEAKKFEAPDTFVQFAKMGREANALEIQAEKLKHAREDLKKTRNGQILKFVSSYVLLPASLGFAYWFWPSELAVMEVPNKSWIWPLGSLVALPNQPPNGSVSSCGWMFLSRRVLGRRLLKF
ncbi:hypothetical protein BASA81_008313 [Batrachochytrium salamandrivorans]|nr:hypothetical protein BASA81_008313 [Batrachochytrium salamandrivorans]